MALVKICGLSTLKAIDTAIDAGADFIGLVFFAKSPRNVTLRQAAMLADHARDRIKIVALVVDADDIALQNIRDLVQPDFFQLHGKETVDRVREIGFVTSTKLIKAQKVSEASHITAAQNYAPHVAFTLFDALAANEPLPGGNGLAFDWQLLQGAKNPFMLAGGLNPSNVGQAIAVTNAAMVDVSSGVESSAGVKDLNLIRKFIEAAKA
jgi:phosphoribosylanthranilate isomerase